MGDSLCLFLWVQPSGGRLLRLKYRIDGREKKLGIGTYPEVSLSDSRRRRDEAREMIAAGKDPSREKQREKLRSKELAGDTFTLRSEEHTSELQPLMRSSYAVFCLKKKKITNSTIQKAQYLYTIDITHTTSIPSQNVC